MQEFHARTVVRYEGVSNACDEYEKTVHRFEEAYRALEWLLARNPFRGMKIGRSDWYVYVQDGDRAARTPAIWVLYTFTDNEVFIHALRCADAA